MLKAELLEIVVNGENSGIEFKRDNIRPEQLAKEIVAFGSGGLLHVEVLPVAGTSLPNLNGIRRVQK